MEDAATRRERLKALRAAADAIQEAEQPVAHSADAAPAAQVEKQDDEPTLKFRNYAVNDAKITHEKVSFHCYLSTINIKSNFYMM